MIELTSTKNCNSVADITGEKFGRLTAVGRVGRSGKSSVWLCLCSCGNVKEVLLGNLRKGHVRSCGCYQREVVTKRAYQVHYSALLRVHARGKIPCTLTYEEFLEFTKISRCHYCNAPIEWREHIRFREGSPKGYFLDRKDNTLGYITGNLVVCCKRCNFSKANRFSYFEWYCMTACLRRWRANGWTESRFPSPSSAVIFPEWMKMELQYAGRLR